MTALYIGSKEKIDSKQFLGSKECIDFDKILYELGEYGRYQKQNYFLILFVMIFSAVNNSQYVFMAAITKAR